jgi:hypothetical protein
MQRHLNRVYQAQMPASTTPGRCLDKGGSANLGVVQGRHIAMGHIANCLNGCERNMQASAGPAFPSAICEAMCGSPLQYIHTYNIHTIYGQDWRERHAHMRRIAPCRSLCTDPTHQESMQRRCWTMVVEPMYPFINLKRVIPFLALFAQGM